MGKQSPLVSIITPAYNAGSLLPSTINSVMSQTYTNWEMIIVDDCSKDGTREVVEGYAEKDARIRLLPLLKNCGAPAAPRNIGVAEARGEWVAFLDADDIWHPQKLELQIDALQKHDAYFCCTQMKDFTDDASFSFPSLGQVDCASLCFSALQVKNLVPTSSVILKREVIQNIPFNEDMRYKAVEDYHCWLRVHEMYGSSIKLEYPLLKYRKIAGQLSGSKIAMLKRVYMLHREYPRVGWLKALFYTFTYAVGGIYYRLLRKGL